VNENIKIYRAIILTVDLYDSEAWSPKFREECRLKVFENRVLRGLFVPERDGVTGERRKLHNEELNYLYCSRNIVRVIKLRRMRWARHVARMGRAEAYTGFRWGNMWEREHWGDQAQMGD